MNSDMHADTSWRPTTRNLGEELPVLMGSMHGDGFEVYRVMYNPADWDDTPRRIAIGGRVLKLGWYRTQDRGVITVVDGSNRNRLRVRATS